MTTSTTEIHLTGEFIVKALKESEAHNQSSIARLSNVALGLKDIFESNTAGECSRERKEA